MTTATFAGAIKLASVEKMRLAILYGRLITRDGGMSIYSYKDQYFIFSDRDLGERQPGEPLIASQLPDDPAYDTTLSALSDALNDEK